MKKSFFELVKEDIVEKFKNSNIVIWYDTNNEFKQEFDLINLEGINKIAYKGSFIELRYNIFSKDRDLTKKWLIYTNNETTFGFYEEYEYFGEKYVVSIKEILERKFNIEFSNFDISTVEKRLQILKRLWDVIPEDIVSNLNQETLDDIVLTNGFGYVDINKEYTILKYICEPYVYDSLLEEAKIKDKFFEFISLEYGIDVERELPVDNIVEAIVEYLFQCEIIMKSRKKDIVPFGIKVGNSSKILNCVQLLETWSNHDIYKDKFIDYSKHISNKYIKQLLNCIELDELLGIEYLFGVEELLYKKLQIEVVKGKTYGEVLQEDVKSILVSSVLEGKDLYDGNSIDLSISNEQVNDIKIFLDVRKRYYFSKVKVFNKWSLLSNIFNTLDLLNKFRESFSSSYDNFEDIIYNYKDNNWWKIDLLYRKIQEQYFEFDDFVSLLFKKVDGLYHYTYLKTINEEVSNVIDKKIDFNFKVDIQHNFWTKFVTTSNNQTAILVVDALRYEMGMELFGLIEGKISKDITPMISSVPTITEFGMAALLPNGGAKLNVGYDKDNFKISDGNYNISLNNKQDRIKYFLQQAGTLGFVKNLNEVIDEPNNSLKNMFEGKSRIIIYSNEIDEAGHIEDTNIQLFPTLINKINVSIKKLLDIGIERILIVADHGFMLTSGLEDWMKIDIQKDMDCIIKRRRFSISKNKIEGNYITKRSNSVNHNGNLYFNFPRGINVFSAAGGSKFLHGGISIQELLIPVIEINNIKVTNNLMQQEPVEYTIQAIDIDSLLAKAKGTPKPIQQQLMAYIDKNDLTKKQKKILELFMKSKQYKDSEIQEICSKEGIRFITESVMKFMDKFTSELQTQGHDWIGMRVVGLSTLEYFLKEEE